MGFFSKRKRQRDEKELEKVRKQRKELEARAGTHKTINKERKRIRKARKTIQGDTKSFGEFLGDAGKTLDKIRGSELLNTMADNVRGSSGTGFNIPGVNTGVNLPGQSRERRPRKKKSKKKRIVIEI